MGDKSRTVLQVLLILGGILLLLVGICFVAVIHGSHQ